MLHQAYHKQLNLKNQSPVRGLVQPQTFSFYEVPNALAVILGRTLASPLLGNVSWEWGPSSVVKVIFGPSIGFSICIRLSLEYGSG